MTATTRMAWYDTPAGHGVRAFRNQPFRRLSAGFAANQSGFWLSHLSMQGLVADLTGADPFKNSLLFTAMFVPATIFPFVAGVYLDQRDRKHIVLLSYGVVAAIAYAFAALTFTGHQSIPTVLFLAVLLGTTFAMMGPAVGSLMANTVPIEDIRSAITIQSSINNLSRIAGPILATPLIAAGKYTLAFSIYATATVMALLILRGVEPNPAAIVVDETSFVQRLREGFAHARERRPALKLLATQVALSVFGVGHTALIPTFAKEALDAPKRFALLGAATGAGALLGALLNGYDRRPARLTRAAWYLVGYGVCLVAFAFTTTLWLAIVTQAAVGIFYFLCATQIQTMVQLLVDDSKRGRVMALHQVSWGGVVWIGTLGLGAIAGPFGAPVRWVLAATAVICVVIGLAMTVIGRGEPDVDAYG